MLVSAIVPAYNEEGWVGKTVETLFKIPEIGEVIVSDDGSTDKTSHEAWEAGAIVCRSSLNRGKCQALREGVYISRGEILAFVDADLKESAEQIKYLIYAVMTNETDMAIASFKTDKPAGLGLTKSLAYWGIRCFTGEKMQTPLSGQRVIKRELWNLLNFQAEGLALRLRLPLNAFKNGFRVKEIPAVSPQVWRKRS